MCVLYLSYSLLIVHIDEVIGIYYSLVNLMKKLSAQFFFGFYTFNRGRLMACI